MTSGKILKIDPQAPDQELIEMISEKIKNNQVVVSPTETRYGLLVRVDNQKNVDRIYNIKKRNQNLPISIFLNNRNDLKKHIHINKAVNLLSEKFLPGPLTIVGESVSELKSPVVLNGKIGLRVSSNRLISALIDRLELPLSATSANLSGQPEPLTCAEVYESLGDEVDLYLDGGSLEGPVSTVVDVSSAPPKILREGAISSEKIFLALGGLE